MNSTKKFAIAIILLITASIITIPALIKQKTIAGNSQAQNTAFVLYYGNTCPHCKIVEQYIKDNDLTERFEITQKEVYQNQANRQEFAENAQACGLDINNLGVPMLWDAKDKRCYTGDQTIIDFFKQSVNLP